MFYGSLAVLFLIKLQNSFSVWNLILQPFFKYSMENFLEKLAKNILEKNFSAK